MAWYDPVTGELVRAQHAAGRRYERDRAGELIHIDVKKLGRIPDGGGWRARGQRTIDHIERVISDNAWAYRKSADFKAAGTQLGAVQKFIKPHCPWTHGKIERFNRTLATEWAYRRPCISNTERTQALDPWLNYYNNERIHTGIGTTPNNRVSPT